MKPRRDWKEEELQDIGEGGNIGVNQGGKKGCIAPIMPFLFDLATIYRVCFDWFVC